MTHAGLDHRVSKLEGRVADIEESHGNSIYNLTRSVQGLTLFAHRQSAHSNAVGRGIALMMERLGLPPIEIPEVKMPTDQEIDDFFEEEV